MARTKEEQAAALKGISDDIQVRPGDIKHEA